MPQILIVDDDENNRAVAADALASEEYELTEAVDGHDCLQKVAQQSFDLILLDVMMPGIDGIETLRQLKANEASRGVPVIMLTALNMDSQVTACLDEGAIDHVSKPFSHMVLRARVRAALRSQGQLAAGPTTLQRSKVLALIGAKGGVGATTLAINIGAKLAQTGKKAIVCEMQADAVSAEVQLGLTPRLYPEPLFGKKGVRIARRAIEKNMLNHSSGIHLLLGLFESQGGDEPSTEAVSELVRSLREIAQYTILDVGTGQSSSAREVLRQADRVLLVFELEPCSLFAAQKRLEQFGQFGIQPSSICAVINNRVHVPSPVVGLNDARERLSCDILGVIPADPEGCFMSIKQRNPICLACPQSTTSGALTALVNRLSDEQAAALSC